MALKNFSQLGLGLMLGVAGGYSLRPSQPPIRVSSSSTADLTAAPAAIPPGSWGQAAAVTKADGSPPPSVPTLGERMKGLLDHYNDASARKDLESLSEPEIQSALALMAAMPKSPDRDSLRANLYRAWAKKNPNGAWKAALADTVDTDKSNLGAVAGEIAKTRPDTAVGLALSLGMGSKRSDVLHQVFEEWSKADLPGAVAYLNKYPDLPAVYWSVAQAIAKSGETDPLQAAGLALTLKDPQLRSSALSSLMSQWASHDPQAAIQWAKGLDNLVLRQEAIAQAISGWAGKDPQAAMAEAQTIPDASARSTASQAAWLSWFQKDPAAAMTYLGGSNDEKMLQNIGWSISRDGALTAQETAALLDKLPDSKVKQEIIRWVANSQVQKGQYSQALEMLNNMQESGSRDWTLLELGKKWAESDLPAATAWLNLQPDSSDRDMAVAGFAATLARTDPQGALRWADTIPDEGVKLSALKNIALRWLTNDPVRAEAWLATLSNLSDDDKKNLRDSAQRSGPDRMSYGFSVSNRR